jgi:hypothetical protein
MLIQTSWNQFSLALLLLGAVVTGPMAQAQSTGGTPGPIARTQGKRAAERFNILDWIAKNNRARSAQDSKYGRGSSGSNLHPDLTLMYRADKAKVSRDGSDLGHDTRYTAKLQFLLDDVFTQGNKGRSLNVDIGVEGFYSKTSAFAAEPRVIQESHSFSETGAGLLLRPFGRSSQDTGLMFKGGYMEVSQLGFWSNSTTTYKMPGTYLGAELKLYLLPFLGGMADYTTVLETKNDDLLGKWKMYRFLYGGFIEVYLLNLQFYFFNSEYIFTPDSGATPRKELSVGAGFGAALHF